ncbi:MAG: GTPase, partial [Hyphomicrobium sp.]
MRQQSEAAIATADLILFVIDAREGVTSDDQSFGKLVRSSGRPVVLVANKSEGRAAEEGFYAAYELGFGEPVASQPSMARVSAISMPRCCRRWASSRNIQKMRTPRNSWRRCGRSASPSSGVQRRQVDAGQRAARRGA